MNPDWWFESPIEEVVAGGFTDEGDARNRGVKGASPKRMLRSKLNGHLYLYKAESQEGKPQEFRAQADHTAAALAAALFEPGYYIPVGLFKLHYGKGPVVGSIQPLIENAETKDFRLWIKYANSQDERAKKYTLPDFSDDDLATIQREQVLDWLISNHDSHGNQWIRVDGRLLGIDKTQVCKHLGEDQLEPRLSP